MIQRDRAKSSQSAQATLDDQPNMPSAGELLSSHNLLFIEALYEDYIQDPSSVEPKWQTYFTAFETGDWTPVNGAIKVNGSAPQIAPTPRNPRVSLTSPTRNSTQPIMQVVATSQPTPVPTKDTNEHIGFLRNYRLFRDMKPEELTQIASIVREVTFPAGAAVCREGEEGKALYILVSGVVEVQRQGRYIVDLGPGEVIGELSVLDKHPRSADVITKTESCMLEIKGDELRTLLFENSGLIDGLLGVLVGRVREASNQQERVTQLVHTYREKGHALAKLDPLGKEVDPNSQPELTLGYHGLSEDDLDTRFSMLLGDEVNYPTLRQIIDNLKKLYCGAIGIQYTHIDNLYIQDWLRDRIENPIHDSALDRTTQLRILTKLTDAELLETFLHRKFLGAKRFSLEGAESLIPLMDEAIEKAGEYGVEEVIIGMAHRGRLNVLANILQKPTSLIFREFEDIDPQLHANGGDVKYHLGYSYDHTTASGQDVHLSLCFNPSHLETVGPVVLGRVRAKQDQMQDVEHKKVLPIIIHGDAAFIGQGVVQEIFNMSELPGYSVGGTVHIIVNNQIGFTTSPDDSRSSAYATDVARMLQIPVFHVNGEDPEAVHRVIQIAMDFRKTFQKDVVIDMYCYRRHGHNEGDEPAYTQPLLYKTVAKHKSVREAYTENLLKLGGITSQEAEEIAHSSRQRLENELARARQDDYEYLPSQSGQGRWSNYCGGPDADVAPVDTGVERERLTHLMLGQTRLPEDFTPHRKIARQLRTFEKMAHGQAPLNWGAAELAAFATLLAEGVPVRITGQDSQRGTFSHRHATLHDVENGSQYIPFQHLDANQGEFSIYNSPLSETGVLGFEYGYSLDSPEGLVIWEAQFGDFCNMAQVIIDQFITSSEAKWSRLTGLCVLLPHGFEGQGPEHSSARLERFLGLAAMDNIQVVNLTTPAQIFHCLRRQVKRRIRKPLVVMSPKSLLRHKLAVSDLSELTTGRFQRLIPDLDTNIDNEKVERVLLCSGKVYYDLLQAREAEGIQNLPIVRLEQYYPFPMDQLQAVLAQYPAGTQLVWVQEEPENMGAWPFLCRQLYPHFQPTSRHPLSCTARPEAASPATGSKACHDIEQARLLHTALHGK